MRFSDSFIKTLREAPKDETSANAQLLIKGGFIDKLMAGSYTLLPLGRRVEQKIEEIVREEMNATGAQEILMPLLHPKEIWNETGRWDTAAEVMYQFKKDEKEYALSFTHEEIVMDVIRKHIGSYKDLPANLYQFSTKFRSEKRPKSGILRGREFLMKDLYSAHINEEDMWKYYWQVADTYLKVFKRMNLDAIITEAGGGVFTDRLTHEFQVKSEVGEDTIYMADGWKYAKNEEIMTDEDRKAKGLKSIKSIEVGNIFPYGTDKYSDSMKVLYTDKNGDKKPVWFGAYGIGITRLIGVLVEVFHDEHGIIWPESVAPAQIHLIKIGDNKEADEIYDKLIKSGKEVLYDDRDVSAGVKLSDADLIGLPQRWVVSEKTLKEDSVEVKKRSEEKVTLKKISELV
ncbi:MAG: aminoacyl--tRNA ligase-related protein [bacterium]|nr:aminoacyl--tRNA ligase-related protein [bacterium]